MRAQRRIHFIASVLLIFSGCQGGPGASLDAMFGIEAGVFVGNSALSFTPSPHDFGPVQAQSGSATTQVTVKNTSSEFIFLKQFTGENSHFTITGNTCPITPSAFSPNATCVVTIRFTPVTGGILSMALTGLYGLSPGSGVFSASGALSGTGVTPLNFGGITSIDLVKCSSMRANWTPVSGAANYLIFEVAGGGAQSLVGTALSGASSSVITSLTPGVAHTLKVQATDLLGVVTNSVATETATLSAMPVITTISNKTFPSSYLTQGVAMTTVNYANTVTGNDANMSYSCVFDSFPDGAVAAGTACSSLPGTASFNSTSGVLDWTPDSDKTGPYEIKVTGQLYGECDNENIFVADARADYPTANLLGDWDAQFANQSGPVGVGTNTWSNLVSGGSAYDGTLSGTTWTSKWSGAGTVASPYSLGFSGTGQDRVSFGTGLNAQTNLSFGAWIKPGAPTATGKVILGNGGGGDNGFVLRQSVDGGKLELLQGNVDSGAGYQTIIGTLNPVGYWKLDEPSGTSIADASGNGNTGTAGAGVSLGLGGAVSTSGTSANFSGTTSSISIPDHAALNPTTVGLSIAAWVYPTTTAGYRAILGKGDGSGAGYQYLLSLDSGTLYPSLYMTGANAAWSNRATTALTQNAWNHVAVSYNAVTGALNYYVNGAAAGSYAVTATSLVTTTRPLEIGTMINGAYAFTGMLDEVSIFNSVLGSSDITALYNSAPGCRMATALSSSYWTYISGTFDSATKTAKLYANNALQCTAIFPTTIGGSTTALTLGAKSDGSQPWTGDIAQLTMYSSSSITSLSTLYEHTIRRFYDIPVVDSTGLALHLDASRGNGSGFPGSGCATTTWRDLSTTALTGTLSNFSACGTTRGWQGAGGPADPYRFDFIVGSPGNSVNFPNHANTSLTTGITVFAIVKLGTDTSNYRTIIGKGDGAPSYAYLLTLPPGERKMSMYLHNGAGTSPNASWANISSTTIGTGSWQMVAATWDNTTNTLKYYLNGVLDGSYSTTLGGTIGTSTHGVSIGNMIDGTTYPFDGSIPVLLLYDHALDLTAIRAACVTHQAFYTGLNCN